MKNKKKLGAVISLVLLSIILPAFFFYRSNSMVHKFQIIFSPFFGWMVIGALAIVYATRRKINRRAKFLYLFINFLIIILGLFLLYLSPGKLNHLYLISLLPFAKKMTAMSSALTYVLFALISGYAIYNYFFFVTINNSCIRKHLRYVSAFYLVMISALFYFLNPTANDSAIFKLIYLALSGTIFLVNFFYFFDIKTKSVKTRRIYYSLWSFWGALIIGFIFFATELLNIRDTSRLYHTVLLAGLGLYVIAGMLGYAFIKKIYIKKFLYPILAASISVTAVIYFNYFKKDMLVYLFNFFATAIFESLLIVGSIVIWSKKHHALNKRLLFIAIVLFLTALAVFFQLKGPVIIDAELFSFPMIISIVCGIFLNLACLFAMVTLMNSQIQQQVKKKKTERKKQKEAKVKPPFEAYKGTGKYIFISYSHKNMADVFGILKKLFDRGFKIWYDEGIEPGDEWPETLGKAIDRCDKFIAFLSRPAVLSRNVRNEINYAFNKKKDMTIVMLEKTAMTHGLNLQIGTLQSVNKFDMSEKEFYQKLETLLKA